MKYIDRDKQINKLQQVAATAAAAADLQCEAAWQMRIRRRRRSRLGIQMEYIYNCCIFSNTDLNSKRSGKNGAKTDREWEGGSECVRAKS